MKRLKRNLAASAMAAILALTAALPASASTVEHLSLNGIHPGYDMVYVEGQKVRITIENTGETYTSWSTPAPIYYGLWDGSDLVAEGYVYPQQLLHHNPSWDYQFTGEFDSIDPYSDIFDFRIYCDGPSSVCQGNATIEVLE